MQLTSDIQRQKAALLRNVQNLKDKEKFQQHNVESMENEVIIIICYFFLL